MRVVSEPFLDLSRFIVISVLLAWPVGLVLLWLLRTRWNRYYDRLGEAPTEEILGELKSEYAPRRRTIIRTQTEYLPFVFECIRENIDGGFEDPQMLSLLERIELHRPDEERNAMFVVESGGNRGEIHMRWTRDACDRIVLHIQGPPHIVRALREHKRKIPKALVG